MTVCPRVSYSARNCKDLRLSRFNHWRPWGQAHPEGVQGTAAFHDQITDPLLPQADPVLHDAAALDTAMDMLNAQPPLVKRRVRALLLQRQLLATGLLGVHCQVVDPTA